MKGSDVILTPLFQADAELKYRPAIVLREMPLPSQIVGVMDVEHYRCQFKG